jgi:hypothetical protein
MPKKLPEKPKWTLNDNESSWLENFKIPRWDEMTLISREEADLLFPHEYFDKEGTATLLWQRKRRVWNRRGLFFAVDNEGNLWCCVGGLEGPSRPRHQLPRPVSYDVYQVDRGASRYKISADFPPEPTYVWTKNDWHYVPDYTTTFTDQEEALILVKSAKSKFLTE